MALKDEYISKINEALTALPYVLNVLQTLV